MTRRSEPPPIEDHNSPAPPPPRRRNQDVTPKADDSVAQQEDKSLANLLASGQATPNQDAAAQMIAGLVAMRRKPVDPMNDYVGDGTRKLRWVQAAIAHQADLENRTQQDVERDALLGERPIEPALLDAYFMEFYGRPRRAE